MPKKQRYTNDWGVVGDAGGKEAGKLWLLAKQLDIGDPGSGGQPAIEMLFAQLNHLVFDAAAELWLATESDVLVSEGSTEVREDGSY